MNVIDFRPTPPIAIEAALSKRPDAPLMPIFRYVY
jgi:hypothetical protein